MSYKEQREFDDLEKEIAQHEAEKEALEAKLNTGEGSYEDMAAWAEKIGELIALIDEKTDRWMELSE